MYLDNTGYKNTGNSICDGDNWNYDSDEGQVCEICGCFTNQITSFENEEMCIDCANDAKQEKEAELLSEEIYNELKQNGQLP